MASASSALLDGLCLLNTRPSHQQAGLNRLLEAEGARVLSFPSIEIATVEPDAFLLHLKDNINNYQMLIFVSRNAVDGAFHYLDPDCLGETLQLAVIGEGTFKALAAKLPNHQGRIINGEPYNSEGLLATPALNDVGGKNILIFRGQEGRTLLGDTLLNRGARVDHCEVYRRRIPHHRSDDFKSLCAGGFPDLAIFTSTEGMQNLSKMIDENMRRRLLDCPWLLISERMRESAVNLGHNAEIIIARKASDAGICLAVRDWALKH